MSSCKFSTLQRQALLFGGSCVFCYNIFHHFQGAEVAANASTFASDRFPQHPEHISGQFVVAQQSQTCTHPCHHRLATVPAPAARGDAQMGSDKDQSFLFWTCSHSFLDIVLSHATRHRCHAADFGSANAFGNVHHTPTLSFPWQFNGQL
jgi:hypothetical protein